MIQRSVGSNAYRFFVALLGFHVVFTAHGIEIDEM